MTNKPQDITIQILNELGLRKYFDEVIGMHGDFPAKPDPSAIFHLIERFKVEASQTVFLGDSEVDGQTSVAAGIDFAWMDYGYQGFGTTKPKYRFSAARDWELLVR